MFAGLEEFAGRFPALATRAVQDVAIVAIDETGRRAKSGAEALSPHGPTGELKAGWRLVGSGRGAVEALEPVKVLNVAGAGKSGDVAYPLLISQGRRRGPSGRMLGSKQAPRGIKGPVIGQLKRSGEDILNAAIATVEARLG